MSKGYVTTLRGYVTMNGPEQNGMSTLPSPSSIQTNPKASLNQVLAQQPKQQIHGDTQIEGMIATPKTLLSSSWYSDNGASNHVTNDGAK
ncbi:uncharacterized protein G2W53_022621 [Senna tora]|uniref:Uncharacterized protein n=1 Tax=Senna tora TaxID=362788 RepID=A0A834TMZ7_9FABA|nr:uncharacterized protein G2W53_022621 [Senna tora]